MAEDKKLVEAITSMDVDFAQWYTDVCLSLIHIYLLEECMTRITRYGREMRTTFIATMFIACLVIVIGIPFVSKQMFDNEVGYYSISIQGNYIGAANTEDEVNVCLLYTSRCV